MTETLPVPARALEDRGWLRFVASTRGDPAQFRALLRELRAGPGVHSWKWVRGDVLEHEARLRPTVVFYYYGVRKDGRRELAAVGAVAQRLRRSMRLAGFPVIGRCYVRRRFRGLGLYGSLLEHRLGVCARRFGRGLKAVHLGTANRQILAHLDRRRRAGAPFAAIGRERLGPGRGRWVRAFLHLAPRFARRLGAAGSRGDAARREVLEFCRAVPIEGPMRYDLSREVRRPARLARLRRSRQRRR